MTDLSVLRRPAFRRLWIATSISELGSNVGRFAFLLLVHGLSKEGGNPEFHVALVTALETLPMIFLGPIAGAVVDRVDRRWLLVGSDVLSGALMLSIPWLAGLESRVPLYAAALVFSAVGTVFLPTRLSALPDVVPRDQLADANALSTTTSSLNLVLGTVLVAPLIAVFGRTTVFVVDAGAFLLSGALLAALVLPRPADGREVRHFVHEVVHGVVVVARRPALLFLTASYFAAYAFVGAWWPLLPSFVEFSLGVDPDVWAPIAIGSFGAGGFLGAYLAPRLGRRFGFGRAAIASIVVAAAAMQVFASAPHLALALASCSAGGVALFGLMVLDTTLVQSRTEPGVRGRVFGAREPIRAGGMLAASSLILLVASQAEPRELMQGAAALYAALVASAMLLPGARRLWREGRGPRDGGSNETGPAEGGA